MNSDLGLMFMAVQLLSLSTYIHRPSPHFLLFKLLYHLWFNPLFNLRNLFHNYHHTTTTLLVPFPSRRSSTSVTMDSSPFPRSHTLTTIIIMDTHLTGIARPALARYAPHFFPLNYLFGGGGAAEAQLQPPNQLQQQANPPARLPALPNRPPINPRDANHANQRLAQLQRAQQRLQAQREAMAEANQALHAHEAIDARRRDMENMRERMQELQQQRDAARERMRRYH
jgi:hypothetical protein